jgi:hypothetical protein
MYTHNGRSSSGSTEIIKVKIIGPAAQKFDEENKSSGWVELEARSFGVHRKLPSRRLQYSRIKLNLSPLKSTKS